MVVFKYLFVLLSQLAVKNSIGVVHQKSQSPLKNDFDKLPKVLDGNVSSLNDAADGLIDSLNQSAKGVKNMALSLVDSFSKGFNIFDENTAMLNDTARKLGESGVILGDKVQEALSVPLRIVSDGATGNMTIFQNNRQLLEKKEHINNIMNEYLKNHVVELEGTKSSLLNDKYIKLYRDRCRNGDCLTLDTVKVSSMANKVSLNLPRLSQIDYAFALFKQSGAQVDQKAIASLLKRTNYNSLDYFILVLARHNLENLEFLNKNDEALNIFYYKATLFFKKYVIDSQFKNNTDGSPTLTASLGYFVKSDLMEMAQVATLNANLSLEEDEMTEINADFKKYLDTDSENIPNLTLSYAALCKECLEGTFSDNDADEFMRECLNEGKVKTDDICQDEECTLMLDQYLERCKSGDCYTFDNVVLTNSIKIKIMLPSIPQVKLALRTFKNSRAHRGKNFIGFLKRLFKIDREKTLRFFIVTLTKHNIQRNYYNNEGEKVLNQFLYQATLFFVRFLTVSRLVGFYSWCNVTLWMFKQGRYGYLKNLAKNITFGNKVVLSGSNVPLLMHDFEDYLVSSNLPKHANISRYYSNMCKDVMMHYLNADKMSTDLFDAGLDVAPEDVCDKTERIECPSLVQRYLDRCQKGDCYTLDTKDYFTSDRMYKISLPILHQVQAAILIFKKSRSCESHGNRLIKVGGGKKKVDSYVQFYRNLITHNNKFIETKTFENEVLNKYLYNSAVYFKFVDYNKVLDSIDVNHLQDYRNTEYKIESFLKRMLKSLVGIERVRFRYLDIKDLFELYKNYFTTTQVVKNEHGIKVFLLTCEKLLRDFREMQNNDAMFRSYVKNFDNE